MTMAVRRREGRVSVMIITIDGAKTKSGRSAAECFGFLRRDWRRLSLALVPGKRGLMVLLLLLLLQLAVLVGQVRHGPCSLNWPPW